jgi:hypothetical protein
MTPVSNVLRGCGELCAPQICGKAGLRICCSLFGLCACGMDSVGRGGGMPSRLGGRAVVRLFFTRRFQRSSCCYRFSVLCAD